MVRAVISGPAFEFGHQVDQLGAGGGEAIVGGVVVLVVLDQSLLLQMPERAREGSCVDYVGTLRYGMVELGIPQWTVPEGGQDSAVEFASCDVVEGFEVIRQRDSPPPARARERTITV